MGQLHSRGLAVDPITLRDELSRAGKLERAGGEAYLRHVLSAVSTTALVAQHARIILEGAAQSAVDASKGRPLAELRAILDDYAARLGRLAGGGRPLFVRACDAVADPVTWLLDGLLQAGMLAFLSGRDQLGKTLLAWEITRAVLTGDPLLGHFAVHARGPVVAAFLDDPWKLTVQRRDLLGLNDREDLILVDSREAEPGVPLLRDIGQEAKRVSARLIVLDAHYLFVPSGREAGNDAASMRPVVGAFDRLTVQTDATVLVVAHDNLAGRPLAGSHVVRAGAKAILHLRVPRGDKTATHEPPSTSRRELSVEGKTVAHAVHVVENNGPGDWRYVGLPRQARVEDLRGEARRDLADHPASSAEETAKRLKRRTQDVRAAFVAMEIDGEADAAKEPSGRGRPRSVWSLKPGTESLGPDGKSNGQAVNVDGPTTLEDFSSVYPPPKGRENGDGKSVDSQDALLAKQRAVFDGEVIPVRSPSAAVARGPEQQGQL
jgi:hypothetical protein